MRGGRGGAGGATSYPRHPQARTQTHLRLELIHVAIWVHLDVALLVVEGCGVRKGVRSFFSCACGGQAAVSTADGQSCLVAGQACRRHNHTHTCKATKFAMARRVGVGAWRHGVGATGWPPPRVLSFCF